MTRLDQDELHAAAIRDVVAELNRIVAAAHADGLNVDLRVQDLGSGGGRLSNLRERFGNAPIVVATVCRR